MAAYGQLQQNIFLSSRELLHLHFAGNTTRPCWLRRLYQTPPTSYRPALQQPKTSAANPYALSDTWRNGNMIGKRRQSLCSSPSSLVQIIPPGADLPRREWVTLNRLRTRFGANVFRWGLRPSATCLCGAPEQTADHILSECPMLGPPLSSPTDLTNQCQEPVDWLRQLREVV